MVGQTQMFVSQKGVAFDMQGALSAPCEFSGECTGNIFAR